MEDKKFIPFEGHKFSEEEMIQRSEEHYYFMDTRRSIREFSSRPVPREILENIIKTASTAPSGAHKQPWSFCLVSSAEMKRKIKLAAEEQEKENYSSRMSIRWINDLNPFGTNWQKPFLEIAPYLIVVFKRIYETVDGEKHNNYYVSESVGIATGMLLSAIHHAGLCSLTHTPSPLNFLAEVLERPENERAFLLIPVGYAAEEAKIPDIKRKPLHEIVTYF
ncbi:MAG TPA: nitroreductase family protein [Flavobacteriales bacterium]|nr:nitroreductase family protein [Flavobacteriales bacterium]HIO67131.1 nitroreductase family protein [Flavobacteriales bacterium]